MKLHGWGKFPIVDAEVLVPSSTSELRAILLRSDEKPLIARGQGRSYGDSSLSPRVVSSYHLDHFTHFDEQTGLLSCEAGVSFADILAQFVPRGWFLPVTPGTKHVSVGGAIASDVHGKNHHSEGSFCDHLESFSLVLACGEKVVCSRLERYDLFRATCGGMGLTGFIVEACFRLKPISSAYICETRLKARNIEETLAIFESKADASYSVSWIDCLATGESLGRALVMTGEHSEDGDLDIIRRKPTSVAFNMPDCLMNRFSIRAFNELYYRRTYRQVSQYTSHYESFFYPLDRLSHWYRLYGKNGFIQYQFVLPFQSGIDGISRILKRIAESQRGSFLGVLKVLGKGNDNYLSFPQAGYTLAVDFKMDKGLASELEVLDKMVVEYGGRLYLSKDARMSEAIFKQSYSQWKQFQSVRSETGADKIFRSQQSLRLGI